MVALTDIEERVWFETPIWSVCLPNAEIINKHLLNTIALYRGKDEGVVRSNRGGWHSNTKLHQMRELSDLCAHITHVANQAARSVALHPDYEMTITGLWANCSPPGAYHIGHVHPGCAMSGVYYVQSDNNSGAIRFRDPREGRRLQEWPMAEDAHGDERLARVAAYAPVEGQMILFPNWLEHEVEQNTSSQERISISFNLNLRKRSQPASP